MYASEPTMVYIRKKDKKESDFVEYAGYIRIGMICLLMTPLIMLPF
jgi:hypothetical protein